MFVTLVDVREAIFDGEAPRALLNQETEVENVFHRLCERLRVHKEVEEAHRTAVGRESVSHHFEARVRGLHQLVVLGSHVFRPLVLRLPLLLVVHRVGFPLPPLLPRHHGLADWAAQELDRRRGGKKGSHRAAEALPVEPPAPRLSVFSVVVLHSPLAQFLQEAVAAHRLVHNRQRGRLFRGCVREGIHVCHVQDRLAHVLGLQSELIIGIAQFMENMCVDISDGCRVRAYFVAHISHLGAYFLSFLLCLPRHKRLLVALNAMFFRSGC
mmetsp:Transcript_53318/g.91643  ORF Transcript_53318/g.91643 Transcript_53318/m.91643 type:complete len:269 (+) Transcript_53318:627-1433(+)